MRAAVLTATAPTEWARRLVRGAYDLHVHVEPDVMRRRVTGHLSAREARVVAEAAFEAGVRHVIITHPEFPQQDMGLADQVALARQGRSWNAASPPRSPESTTGPGWRPTRQSRTGWP